jgi:hypothetical protein
VIVEEGVVRVVKVNEAVVRIVSVGTQGPGGSSSWRIGVATWAPTMALSWGNYDLIRVTLEGDTEFTSFGTVTDGRRVMLELTHDANGGHEVTWPANVRLSNTLPLISLSVDPNRTDRIGFLYNGVSDTFDAMAVARGF